MEFNQSTGNISGSNANGINVNGDNNKIIQNRSHESVENPAKEKKCFVITPIGEKNSIINRKARGVIEAVIKPILLELDFQPNIPYEKSEPGIITENIIGDILSNELVIANLTGLNPNVMYELAIRHSINKPIVCIAEKTTQLPFDIKTNRVVFYDDDMFEINGMKEELKKSIVAAIEPDAVYSPVYRSFTDMNIWEKIQNSKDPNANIMRLILNKLKQIEKATSYYKASSNTYRSDSKLYIKLGDNNISSHTLSLINALIANFFIELNITIAMIYDVNTNIITIENGYLQEYYTVLLKQNIESLGLHDIDCDYYPF